MNLWEDPAHSVLFNPRWPAADLMFLQEKADEVLARYAQAPSVLLSTSGTTANTWRDVKLVVLQKSRMLAAARSIANEFAFTPADVLLQSLPNFHVGGLSISARAQVAGSRCVFSSAAWRPQDFVDYGAREGITVISLVPTQIYDLVQSQLKPWPQLRLLFSGGAVLGENLERQARELGWPIVATYGMTETSAMFAVRKSADPHEGFSVLPHAEVKITDGGKIAVRAESLADGWARIQKDESMTWHPLTDGEGWFETEDRGEMRAGRVFVQGRESETVKVKGELVSLAHLKNIMSEEADRKKLDPLQSHIIALPHARDGVEIVLAHIKSFPAREVVEIFNQRVLPFERISRILLVDRIPRNELGKVLEARLREELK